MLAAFYIASVIAVLSTVMVITCLNAVHALLYLIVSLLSIAVIFFVLGAPFMAALEVIVYAGAIMVLFVFVVMMLNLGQRATAQERRWLTPGMWIVPGLLSLILLGEVVFVLARHPAQPFTAQMVDPKAVGTALFGPYMAGVQLAALLLLVALVGAYYLGSPSRRKDS
jgi:NADH-quinone oxidoreductase subunit J